MFPGSAQQIKVLLAGSNAMNYLLDWSRDFGRPCLLKDLLIECHVLQSWLRHNPHWLQWDQDPSIGKTCSITNQLENHPPHLEGGYFRVQKHSAFTLSSGKQSCRTGSCQYLEASVTPPNATADHGYAIGCQFETMPCVWGWKSPCADAEHKNCGLSKAYLGEVAETVTAEKSCAGPQNKASFTQVACHGVLEVDNNIVNRVPTPPSSLLFLCTQNPLWCQVEYWVDEDQAPDVQLKALQRKEHGLKHTYHCLHLLEAASQWAACRWLAWRPPAPGGLVREWRSARAQTVAREARKKLVGIAKGRPAAQRGAEPMGSTWEGAADPSPPAEAPRQGWCFGAVKIEEK